MFSKKKNNKGFTLVELLVVIAIIGILAVVALPTLFKNIDKSKVASLESDISAIKSATISYVTDNNVLPEVSENKGAIVENLGGNLEGLSDPYDAVYNLSSDSKEGTVTLKITLPEALSETAINKLNNDLGSLGTEKDALKVTNGNAKVTSVVGSDNKVITVTVVKDAKGLGVKE
ncbi:type II secretion system protein [Terrisporobacter sp.]